ncbi:MAG: integrase core domain-containing protein [Vicinamibacterales bacterium]
MKSALISLLLTLHGLARSRAALHLEVLALRHQLQVLETVAAATGAAGESGPLAVGVFVALVDRLANRSRHRQAGDRHRVASPRLPLVLDMEKSPTHGRPTVAADVRALIRTMSQSNPLWGAPRIHGELLKLGLDVCQATVAKYMVRRAKPPSQTWRTFLANHVHQIAAADFFVVPTATCRLLFVLVLLAHERRRVVHVAVTDHPTAAWTSQQLREAFPWNDAPRYLVHDRDTAFHAWATTAPAIGSNDVLTAVRSPWQNAYAERLIGSIRRECLDHVIIANAHGLRRVLDAYVKYYLKSRTHVSLDKDAPMSRQVASLGDGDIVTISHLGGLHHHYERRAA